MGVSVVLCLNLVNLALLGAGDSTDAVSFFFFLSLGYNFRFDFLKLKYF